MKSPLSRPSSSSFNQEMEGKDHSLPFLFSMHREVWMVPPQGSAECSIQAGTMSRTRLRGWTWWVERWWGTATRPCGCPPWHSPPCPLHRTAITRVSCPLRPLPLLPQKYTHGCQPTPSQQCSVFAYPLPLSALVPGRYSHSTYSHGNSTIFLFKWMFVKCFSSRGWVED